MFFLKKDAFLLSKKEESASFILFFVLSVESSADFRCLFNPKVYL